MEKIPTFKAIALSKLAEVEIADRDYTEGKKRHFTFDEALEVEKKLKGTGWRLPTRHEWALICEEFANGEDDSLNPEMLEEKLGLGKHGIVPFNTGPLYLPGTEATYWSRSSNNSGDVFSLYFNNSYVGPSSYSYRYAGLSLRFVKDLSYED